MWGLIRISMADLIQYSLDTFTDFRRFEQLALEVLHHEGYEGLHAIGGIADDGIDAEQVKYFRSTDERTVFQFTIQENTLAKTRQTVKRLAESKVTYKDLVIVTKREVENVGEIRRKLLKEQDAIVDVIDRRTFVKILGNKTNGLYNRFFANVESQLKDIGSSEIPLFTDASLSKLEQTLLKCSLLFSFNDGADFARRSLVDYTILASILDSPGTPTSIVKDLESSFKLRLQEIEVAQAIDRLKRKDYVRENRGKYIPSDHIQKSIGLQIDTVNRGTERFLTRIVEAWAALLSSPPTLAHVSSAKKNVKRALTAFFQLHGVDVISDFTNMTKKGILGLQNNQDLVRVLSTGFGTEMSSALVYSVGRALENPDSLDLAVIQGWLRAHVGAQIMGFDPRLNEFQVTRMRKKTCSTPQKLDR